MRTAGVVLAALLSVAVFGDEAHPSPRFRTVYILEMADALDQYIASRLSSAGVLWVVLDPASADTVLTDAIDAAFWTWLQRTYPPLKDASAGEVSRTSTIKPDVPPAGKPRGTVFLVDPRKKLVLWSTYDLPKNESPAELDHVAIRITVQLKIVFGKR